LKLYSPRPPEVVDMRERESVRSTVAPGTTPPLSSTTVPETVDCAYSGDASINTAANTNTKRFIEPPRQLGCRYGTANRDDRRQTSVDVRSKPVEMCRLKIRRSYEPPTRGRASRPRRSDRG